MFTKDHQLIIPHRGLDEGRNGVSLERRNDYGPIDQLTEKTECGDQGRFGFGNQNTNFFVCLLLSVAKTKTMTKSNLGRKGFAFLHFLITVH